MAVKTKAELLAEIDYLNKVREGYKLEDIEILRLENLGLLHHIEVLKKQMLSENPFISLNKKDKEIVMVLINYLSNRN